MPSTGGSTQSVQTAPTGARLWKGYQVAAAWLRRKLAWLALAKVRFGVLNVIRWSILAGLLVFLLTAILALHEALNFQDRVADLAGDDRDRARRVLVILHDTLENPENYNEDHELPYAALAVKLDRLSKVQAQLKEFDLSDPKGDAKPNLQGASAQPAAATGGVNGTAHPTPSGKAAEDDLAKKYPQDVWKSRSHQLKLSIAELEETLKTGFPARKLVDAFKTAKEHLQVLKRFKGSIETADDEPATEEAKKRYSLQQVTEKLNKALVGLTAQADFLPEDLLTAKRLDVLQKEIEGLDRFYHAADLKVGAPKKDAKASALPIDLAVELIGQQIGEIEALLLEADEGFVAAHELAQLVNQTRSFHDHIDSLPTDEIRWQPVESDQDTSGAVVQSKFNTYMGELANAIQEMEQELGRRTRVMIVAEQLNDMGVKDGEGRNGRALAILRDFDAVGRFKATLMPFSGLGDTPVLRHASGLGFDPQRIATLSRETLALLFVFVIGAIGSVIYITKYSIQLVLEGNWLTDRPKRSLAWFLFRPFFGVIVALAAFLLFKAGQLAMGNSGVADGHGDFNLPVLSVIALFAGLLSWQALEMIETRGASWFRSQKRQFLWATGLNNGLRTDMHSREELASSIGRSVDQVFRWLVFRDRVSPEMQDRIADWLNVPYNQLFQSEEPARKPLWLKVAPADPTGIAREEFETLLAGEHFQTEKLKNWLSQRENVPPMAHDRVILAMDRPMQAIFTDEKPSSADEPSMPSGGGSGRAAGQA